MMSCRPISQSPIPPLMTGDNLQFMSGIPHPPGNNHSVGGLPSVITIIINQQQSNTWCGQSPKSTFSSWPKIHDLSTNSTALNYRKASRRGKALTFREAWILLNSMLVIVKAMDLTGSLCQHTGAWGNSLVAVTGQGWGLLSQGMCPQVGNHTIALHNNVIVVMMSYTGCP